MWIWHFWSVPTDLVDFPWIFIHGTCFNQIIQLKSLVNCLKLGRTVRVWIPVSSEGPLVGRIKRIIEHSGFNGIPWKSLNSQNSMEWDKHTYFRYNIQIYIHIYIYPYYRIWYIYIYIHTYIHTWCTICIIYVCYIYTYYETNYMSYVAHVWNFTTCCQSSTDFFCSAYSRSCDATASCWSTLESGHLKGAVFFQEKTLKETPFLRVGAENRFIWDKSLGSFSRLMRNRLSPCFFMGKFFFSKCNSKPPRYRKKISIRCKSETPVQWDCFGGR